MKIRMLLPLLLVTAAITPASANWFSNPKLGINRCVCTAPSPTPAQVRADRQPPFVLHEQAPAVTVADASRQQAPAQPQQAPAR